MLNRVHDHIVSELNQSSRTDTIFVVTAIAFNLIVLGINSGVASAGTGRRLDPANDIVLIVFIIMTFLINTIAISALNLGKRTRQMLLNGLVKMYGDNEVDKYYDPSLMSNYDARYLLFSGVIGTLALVAIVVPLIIRFL
ncbi:MAG: hypothetical protein KAR65_07435 [Anaerolineales bacterium]|nr:hypothetical protein [Anaerolineales bacterium]